MVENKQHVLIAGAGVGGLTLAQCLRAKNHPFTIFERDVSSSSRSQGWCIALHTVLADLVASVPDDMPSIETTSHLLPFADLPAQMCFYDCQSERLPSHRYIVDSKPNDEVGYGKGRVIRANRDRLREWLCTSIDVQWGKQVTGFTQDDHGVAVTFTDGTTVKGDILIGAEGARSVIRDSLVSNAHLRNVPACFVTGEVTLGREEYTKHMRLANSAYAILGPDFQMFVGLNRIADDGSSADYYWDLIWYDEARSGNHWIDSASAQELYDFTLNKTQTIDSRFTDIVRLTGPRGMKTPPMILRDLDLEQMPVSRVTLLGDAAHAMVPFRGEGGCHAIDDAIKLSQLLTSDTADLGQYQEEMLERGSNAMKASRAAGVGGSASQTDERIAWGQSVRMEPMPI